MPHCSTCGAALAADAEECAQCVASTIEVRRGPVAPRQRTRWGKTSTTFGPFGRLLWTFLMLVPAGVLTYFYFRYPGRAQTGFAIGLVLWIVIVLRVLRDIWKAG